MFALQTQSAVLEVLTEIPEDIAAHFGGKEGLISQLSDENTEISAFHRLLIAFTLTGSLAPENQNIYLKLLTYGVIRGIVAPAAIQAAKALIEQSCHQVAIGAPRTRKTNPEDQLFLASVMGTSTGVSGIPAPPKKEIPTEAETTALTITVDPGLQEDISKSKETKRFRTAPRSFRARYGAEGQANGEE